MHDQGVEGTFFFSFLCFASLSFSLRLDVYPPRKDGLDGDDIWKREGGCFVRVGMNQTRLSVLGGWSHRWMVEWMDGRAHAAGRRVRRGRKCGEGGNIRGGQG
jgi:hypothetical protein